MNATIPIKASGTSGKVLSDELSELRIPGLSLGKPSSGGLAVDPGTVLLIVELAKVTLPALLAAIATVWAAKISKGSSEKPKIEGQRKPQLVLEFDTFETPIEIEACREGRIPQEAHRNLDSLVRIRLEE
jgi:hypothetical protein